MKYFNPSYWFKLWLLSAPLFNDKTQGINAKSIDNKKIKDWASNNTSLESINQEINFTNSSTNYQSYNLSETNKSINPFYQTDLDSISSQQLETSTHKHRHEKSRRIKKQVTPNPKPTKEILTLNEKLIIDRNNRREYQNSFRSNINELINYGIFSRVIDLNILVNPEINLDDDDSILALNSVRYGYFRLPVEIRWEENQHTEIRNLELVLRTDNLYLQGFIVTYHPGGHLPDITNYYHFDFRNINMNLQPIAVRDGTVPLLTQIEGITNIQLTGISPDYRDLLNTNDDNVNWSNIFDSFLTMTNDINVAQEGRLGNLARSLGNVIVVTAESLRFWSLHTHIIQQLVNNNDGHIVLGRNRQNPIYNTLISWSEESRTQSFIIDLLSTPRDSRPNSPEQARNILIEHGYLRRRDNESFINLLARILILPINDIINVLAHSNIRIILSYFIKRNLDNCNRRQARQITNNNYWHKQFCDLKPEIDKIQGKITGIKVLDENTKGGNLKAGTIYVGTENGVYIIYPEGEVHKFDGLNFPITSIKLDNSGSAYITNNQEEVYHLNLVGWGSEKLNNFKSSNLESELKINYNSIPEYELRKYDWLDDTDDSRSDCWILSMDLGKINPVDNYKKLVFFGDLKSQGWGTQVKWGNDVYNGDSLNDYMKERNYEFHHDKHVIIRNEKARWIEPGGTCTEHLKSLAPFSIQEGWKQSGSANLHIIQRFGLLYHWDKNNYYLQVVIYQQISTTWSFTKLGEARFKVGRGIKLYNDDNKLETQISNPNDRKRREIFEEKNELQNTTQWDKNITNFINHEQHLPIDNKTNFVTNNITSF